MPKRRSPGKQSAAKRGRNAAEQKAAKQAALAEAEQEEQFEDAFCDEFEDEPQDAVVPGAPVPGGPVPGGPAAGAAAAAGGGVVVGDDEEMQQELQDSDDEAAEGEVRVFNPGKDVVGEGEELTFSNKAYRMLHRLRTVWPCLSFDVIPDSLGQARQGVPATCYFVAGTQAGRQGENALMLYKASEMYETQYDSGDEDDEDDNPDNFDDDAVVEIQSVPHPGAVNRVRVQPQQPHLVASWSEQGSVHVWDMRPQMARIDGSTSGPGVLSVPARRGIVERQLEAASNGIATPASAPMFSHKHETEGFALAWSKCTSGRIASGDCGGDLRVWEPTAAAESAAAAAGAPFASWSVGVQPYTGHRGSVEDIAFSPVQGNAMATCGVDGTVRIWDTRTPDGCKMLVEAAAEGVDVNVISWHEREPQFVASGHDDGSFKVWDLRNFKSDEPVAFFQWHRGPVTSIEWNPWDKNVLVVTSEDNVTSVWDMSLEEEDEAAAAAAAAGVSGAGAENPPQLLFCHQGLDNVKECHFHRQMPGLMIATGYEGFHVFKPDVTLVDQGDGR